MKKVFQSLINVVQLNSIELIKMTFKNLLLFVTCSFSFNACSTSNNLKSGVLSNNYKYKIDSYAGCCGCEAKYFNINNDKSTIQQIIYSYNCYNEGPPTKYIFNYNEKKQIESCEKFIGTLNNDYTIPITEQEKFILLIIENDSILKPKYGEKQFYKIKGFRKPLEGEITHIFPLIKNGTKIPVN